jgi:hypothetical protein
MLATLAIDGSQVVENALPQGLEPTLIMRLLRHD